MPTCRCNIFIIGTHLCVFVLDYLEGVVDGWTVAEAERVSYMDITSTSLSGTAEHGESLARTSHLQVCLVLRAWRESCKNITSPGLSGTPEHGESLARTSHLQVCLVPQSMERVLQEHHISRSVWCSGHGESLARTLHLQVCLVPQSMERVLQEHHISRSVWCSGHERVLQEHHISKSVWCSGHGESHARTSHLQVCLVLRAWRESCKNITSPSLSGAQGMERVMQEHHISKSVWCSGHGESLTRTSHLQVCLVLRAWRESCKNITSPSLSGVQKWDYQNSRRHSHEEAVNLMLTQKVGVELARKANPYRGIGWKC